MTRVELDTEFTRVYERLLAFAGRKLGDLGHEAVNDAYMHMIENQTYEKVLPGHIKTWVWYKVVREVRRKYKKEEHQMKVKRRVLREVYWFEMKDRL